MASDERTGPVSHPGRRSWGRNGYCRLPRNSTCCRDLRRSPPALHSLPQPLLPNSPPMFLPPRQDGLEFRTFTAWFTLSLICVRVKLALFCMFGSWSSEACPFWTQAPGRGQNVCICLHHQPILPPIYLFLSLIKQKIEASGGWVG